MVCCGGLLVGFGGVGGCVVGVGGSWWVLVGVGGSWWVVGWCLVFLLGFRIQVSSFNFQVPSFKFQVPSSKFQVPSFKFQVSSSKFQVSSSKFQVPSSKFQVPSVGVLVFVWGGTAGWSELVELSCLLSWAAGWVKLLVELSCWWGLSCWVG